MKTPQPPAIAREKQRCPRCGQTFPRPADLTRHLEREHGVTATAPGPGPILTRDGFRR